MSNQVNFHQEVLNLQENHQVEPDKLKSQINQIKDIQQKTIQLTKTQVIQKDLDPHQYINLIQQQESKLQKIQVKQIQHHDIESVQVIVIDKDEQKQPIKLQNVHQPPSDAKDYKQQINNIFTNLSVNNNEKNQNNQEEKKNRAQEHIHKQQIKKQEINKNLNQIKEQDQTQQLGLSEKQISNQKGSMNLEHSVDFQILENIHQNNQDKNFKQEQNKTLLTQAQKKQKKIEISVYQTKIGESIEFKNKGNQQFKNKNYAEAIKLYTDGLKNLDPAAFQGATQSQCVKMAELSANLLYNIGASYFTCKEWQRAQIFLKEAVTINPNYTKALHKRAICFYELNRYQQSMQQIKKANQLDPSNEQIYNSFKKILEAYNQMMRKSKDKLKQMSSKMLRTQSQKKIKQPGQLENSPKRAKKKQQNNNFFSDNWVIPALITVAGISYWGYKKFFK